MTLYFGCVGLTNLEIVIVRRNPSQHREEIQTGGDEVKLTERSTYLSGEVSVSFILSSFD